MTLKFIFIVPRHDFDFFLLDVPSGRGVVDRQCQKIVYVTKKARINLSIPG